MNTRHKFDQNPFVDYKDLKGVLKFRQKRTRTTGLAVDGETGDIIGNIHSFTSVSVDTDEFIKIYFRKIPGWLSGLNNSELVMLEYIFNNTKPGKDIVYIEREQYLMANHLKHNICYYGPINSLMEKKVIARSKMSNWFYINITHFFNGDRVRYFNNLNKSE